MIHNINNTTTTNNNNNNNDNNDKHNNDNNNHSTSLPKIRRQRVFQAFSVPAAEQLRKLLSVGPWGYMFSKTARNLMTTPKGNNFGRNFERNFGSCFLYGLGQDFG